MQFGPFGAASDFFQGREINGASGNFADCASDGRGQ